MKNITILAVGVLLAGAIGLNALTGRYKAFSCKVKGNIFKIDTWTGKIAILGSKDAGEIDMGWIDYPSRPEELK